MNEALVAEAACDYEDGMGPIAAAMSEWAGRQKVSGERDRAALRTIAEHCESALKDQGTIARALMVASRAAAGDTHQRGAVRDVLTRVMEVSRTAISLDVRRTTMELAIVISRAGLGDNLPDTVDGGGRLPHPLRDQLETELRRHGFGLLLVDNAPLTMAWRVLGGETPPAQATSSPASELLRCYLGGRAPDTRATAGAAAPPSQARDGSAVEELSLIAAGETDYAGPRMRRAWERMDMVARRLDAAVIAARRMRSSTTDSEATPEEVTFTTLVGELAAQAHPLVGPGWGLQGRLIGDAAHLLESGDPINYGEAEHLLGGAAALARGVRDNRRVCTPPDAEQGQTPDGRRGQ